jgi:hypothetical protein
MSFRLEGLGLHCMSFRLCCVLLAISVCSLTDPTRLVRNGPRPNKLCGFRVSFSVVPSVNLFLSAYVSIVVVL